MRQVFFLLFFLFILSLKNIEFIAVTLFALLIISYKNSLKLSKKVFKSIVFFNSGVSIGYIAMGYIKGIDPWFYVLYINLKVFTLTYFVFWFFAKTDIVKFFAFSKEFSYLLTITMSQIFSYRKTFSDFRDAFRSRVVTLRDKEKQFIVNVFSFFLKKSMSDSKERTLAMKSRGFFESEK